MMVELIQMTVFPSLIFCLLIQMNYKEKLCLKLSYFPRIDEYLYQLGKCT